MWIYIYIGGCIIFDDSFEHEVKYPSVDTETRNGSEELDNAEDEIKREINWDLPPSPGSTRVVLFFHIPHPLIESGKIKGMTF